MFLQLAKIKIIKASREQLSGVKIMEKKSCV